MPNESQLIAKLIKERDELNTVIAVLQSRSGIRGKSAKRGKRVMSEASREKIRAAQKLRWSKVKKAAGK
jgi:hypothetical protein